MSCGKARAVPQSSSPAGLTRGSMLPACPHGLPGPVFSPAMTNERAKRVLRALELQDVQPGVGVGDIHDALRVDEAIAGLDDARPVRPRIDHALGIGRHECADLAR